MSAPFRSRSGKARVPGVAGVPESDYHENKYARLLDRFVQPGVRWLDIGAGARMHGAWLGPNPEELAARATVLIGTDLHGPHMRANPFLTSAVLSDAGTLPFRDQSFSVISANMVVEHLENPVTVLHEVARVLVRGGVFVISTPNVNNPIIRLSSWILAVRWRRLASRLVERRNLEHIFPTHYRCNTEADLIRMAARAGLRVRALEVFSSYPFAKNRPGLVHLEAGLIRVLAHPRLRGARSNILAVLERPA